ncbi:4'-phosphopantetheinyl transferase superfamily protein [Clostridium gasigenes]|uniref:4'-phosphopantetheinyl transferase family protein n=1 Tax=Clostridium gasigenes TaxID=94869 RepID=UPI0014383832|nr:4'-phosphopantetheinyl transferase superfamily protein [Clostridium gasigenes]NKF08853.1 4'-phosphopantetheinyl transferase superfamily protein [Clostridium gasigenes]QSW21260.1 4'-phosphopantetheinyl transferase superfamily protein [Clostridium gasigenes]
MELYILNIKNEEDIDRYSKLLDNISPEKKERVYRYIRNEDKIRALFSEILIRHIIIKTLKYRNEDIKFEYNKYGKPCLINDKNFHFNISHSGEYIAVIVDNKEVGVDVEKIGDMEIIDLAKRFYTKSEYEYIVKQDEIQQANTFYKIWTLKESYVKFAGKGLSIPLDSFTFSKRNDGNIILQDNNESDKFVYFLSYDITNEYIVSVCSLNEIKDLELTYIEHSELIYDFMNMIN